MNFQMIHRWTSNKQKEENTGLKYTGDNEGVRNRRGNTAGTNYT